MSLLKKHNCRFKIRFPGYEFQSDTMNAKLNDWSFPAPHAMRYTD
jgi:hypothetical protein